MPPKTAAPVNLAPPPPPPQLALDRPRTPNDENIERLGLTFKTQMTLESKWKSRSTQVQQKYGTVTEKYKAAEYSLDRLKKYVFKIDDAFEKLFFLPADKKKPADSPGMQERKAVMETFRLYYLLDTNNSTAGTPVPSRPVTPFELGQMSPEIFRILQVLKKPELPPPAPTQPAKGKAGAPPPPPEIPPEESLIDPTLDLLNTTCPRGLDPAIFKEVLVLRAKRVQIQRLISKLEVALEPVKKRIECLNKLDSLNAYSIRGVELRVGAAKQQELACLSVKDNEDKAWIREKEEKAMREKEKMEASIRGVISPQGADSDTDNS
eukprot:PhF_6_TR30377/c0_g1_i1/m.44512